MRSTGERMRGRILDAIAELTELNNRPPTNRELGQYLGGKSTGHIDYHLRILKEQGKISHDPKKSRGIALAESARDAAPQRGRQVPVVGTIAAGRPIEAVLQRDEYVTVPQARDDNLFALRVRGKSMIDDLIDDGDIVVCRRQDTAQNGDTVVALITSGPLESGEATLKRFYRERDRIRLEPRNPSMSPIYVLPGEVLIQGKVVSVIREL
ncbi:MAG TPA: transcriptional repressor LexA [Chloroflexota bacterium]|nr:transcriptional repressor LexA [Chloroflexota bacterium]